jgi:basic amino acid/polyamine antiporter, APA family
VKRELSVWHAAAICVGMVIGTGIFKAAPQVAANLPSQHAVLAFWILGGALSLLGALCFAEMTSKYPHTGGDYHFLSLAYGKRLGLLFAWSRFSVIHSGSMGLMAFTFGDYAQTFLPLPLPVGSPLSLGSALYGAGLVMLLTLLNVRGTKVGINAQVMFLTTVLIGMFVCLVAGVCIKAGGALPAVSTIASTVPTAAQHWPLALVFVLFTYGGYSDAATLAQEMRDRRSIQKALLYGMVGVAVLYVAINWAYLQGLGLQGLAQSKVPAADLARAAFGDVGAIAMVVLVAITSISILNALMIVGARTTYAAAADLPKLNQHIGAWDETRNAPVAAMYAMSAIALLLIAFGAMKRDGFTALIDYLNPVYWLFMTLSAIAVIVLRRREHEASTEKKDTFSVPLFPFTPVLFAITSAYLCYASLAYAGLGAWLGLATLLLGLALIRWADRPMPSNH